MQIFSKNNESRKCVLELKVFDNDTINLKINGVKINPSSFKIESDIETPTSISLEGCPIFLVDPNYLNSIKGEKL